MYQLTVGQFKSKFSEVLGKVLQGESVGITYGKNKKKGKASFKIRDGFKMTDEEFLRL